MHTLQVENNGINVLWAKEENNQPDCYWRKVQKSGSATVWVTCASTIDTGK